MPLAAERRHNNSRGRSALARKATVRVDAISPAAERRHGRLSAIRGVAATRLSWRQRIETVALREYALRPRLLEAFRR